MWIQKYSGMFPLGSVLSLWFPSLLLTLGLLVWWMTLWHYFGPERHWGAGCPARGMWPFSGYVLSGKDASGREFNEGGSRTFQLRHQEKTSNWWRKNRRNTFWITSMALSFILSVAQCDENIHNLPPVEQSIQKRDLIFLK